MNEKMTEFTKILEKACKANVPNEWDSSVPVVSDGNRHYMSIFVPT